MNGFLGGRIKVITRIVKEISNRLFEQWEVQTEDFQSKVSTSQNRKRSTLKDDYIFVERRKKARIQFFRFS